MKRGLTFSRQSACPLDCPDACSLVVRTDGTRVLEIDGDRRNPLTDGFICAKIRGFEAQLYGAERIGQPALRDGKKGEGKVRPVSWQHALTELVERLTRCRDEHGGESILPLGYGGSNGYLTQDTVDERFFRRLGASRLLRSLCAAPSSAAANLLYGKMPGVALEDYRLADLIIVWGCNPSASGIHLLPVIKKAKRRGAKLIVIDPRRTPLAGVADVHVALKPGTDLVFALGLANWLYEEQAVDQTFIDEHCRGAKDHRAAAARWSSERVAVTCDIDSAVLGQVGELYRQASPAVIRCGWGVERNRNGGAAVAAILALPAIAGKFGVAGGGYTMSNTALWQPNVERAVNEDERDTRVVNINRAGRAIAELSEPPVKLIFVYNGNPLATLPDQQRLRAALEREDIFTVVFEQVMTDTARYADLLLPATTFLEHHELSRGYGARVLNRSEPAIPPIGEARPNYEVFDELITRMGLGRADDPRTPDELVAAMFDDPDMAPLVAGASSCRAPEVLFVDQFPLTEDKKVDLFAKSAPRDLYDYQPELATKEFPLSLISPASAKTISSTLAQANATAAVLSLHPRDAEQRAITDGAWVRVFNALGEVVCRARITDSMRPLVVMLPKGIWMGHTKSGTTSNTLIPDGLTDLGQGGCFNDARVQVEPQS